MAAVVSEWRPPKLIDEKNAYGYIFHSCRRKDNDREFWRCEKKTATAKLCNYVEADERILHLIQDYQNRNLTDYLRGSAPNFEMNQ